ncbi:MAG: EAL domain-containing protein [Pseudomonadota bacterium]
MAIVLVAVVAGVYMATPKIMDRISIVDAQNHSLNWLQVMIEEFDLPGEIPTDASHHTTVFDRVVLDPADKVANTHISLFHPERFEKGHHLGLILGYVVFTPYGDRFVSGGRPTDRTLDRAAFRQHFDLSVAHKSVIAFVNEAATVEGRRVISVLVPLKRDGTVRAVAVIDVERTQFEQALFQGVRRSATIVAGILSAIALAVLAMMIGMRRARDEAQDEASFLALHDPLTGLPNRRQFGSLFPAMMAEAEETSSTLALLCLDVDSFKDVNDVYGHLAGDQLLVGISARLKEAIGSAGLVSRLSGDEFTIAIGHIDHQMTLDRLCSSVLKAQQTPYTLDGHEVLASLSIGVAIFPQDARNTEDLMRHADLALYRAKAEGKNRYTFFSPDMDEDLKRKRRLQTELRLAMHRNSLEVHYQPQIDTASGDLKGFEALLRWTHVQDGEISPETFIPIAEESGMIGELGAWVLKTACLEAAAWPTPFELAVNLSPTQFHTGDLVATVKDALDKSGLDPRRLELEITEGVLLQDIETVGIALRELRDLGVGIAMDDFGTGYSSLSYLTRIPLTKIKIDRSFIQQFGSDPNVDAIVNSIIGIGQSLNVSVTAEGVETFEQLHNLQAAGCHLVQGFLYGRPCKDPFTRHDGLEDVQARIKEGLAMQVA